MNETLNGLDVLGRARRASPNRAPNVDSRTSCRFRETRPSSRRHESVLVNESAELVAPSQLDWFRIADTQLLLCWWVSGACRPSERRRAMFVVGVDEFAEDRFGWARWKTSKRSGHS